MIVDQYLSTQVSGYLLIVVRTYTLSSERTHDEMTKIGSALRIPFFYSIPFPSHVDQIAMLHREHFSKWLLSRLWCRMCFFTFRNI